MLKVCKNYVKKINMTRLFVWQFAYRYFLHQLFPISGLVICYSKKSHSPPYLETIRCWILSVFFLICLYRMYRSHHRLEKNEITCFSEKIVYIHYYYNQLQTKLFWSLKTNEKQLSYLLFCTIMKNIMHIQEEAGC